MSIEQMVHDKLHPPSAAVLERRRRDAVEALEAVAASGTPLVMGDDDREQLAEKLGIPVGQAEAEMQAIWSRCAPSEAALLDLGRTLLTTEDGMRELGRIAWQMGVRPKAGWSGWTLP